MFFGEDIWIVYLSIIIGGDGGNDATLSTMLIGVVALFRYGVVFYYNIALNNN